MLNIWFRGGENPDGTPIEVIDAIDFYFKYLFDEEWMEDPFVKEMIRDVDKSEVVAPHIIESPVLGPILPEVLSGGVKTLMMILKTDGFIFNVNHCGDNCAKWILKIAEKKDITIYLGYMMKFEGDFDIKILNTDAEAHNYQEYIEKIFTADEDVFEGTLARPIWK